MGRVTEKAIDELGQSRRHRTTPPTPIRDAFLAAIETFKAEHSEEWNALKLCPLQHGVEEIAAKLKG